VRAARAQQARGARGRAHRPQTHGALQALPRLLLAHESRELRVRAVLGGRDGAAESVSGQDHPSGARSKPAHAVVGQVAPVLARPLHLAGL